MDESGDLSDELDEFEESADEVKQKTSKNQTYTNKPYDEAYEVSQDLSVAESFDGRDKFQNQKERKLKNDKYDEAVEVSQSMDQSNAAPMSMGKPAMKPQVDEKKGGGMLKQTEQTKSQSILNKPFDEALEFSHSGSDDSVDTVSEKKRQSDKSHTETKQVPSSRPAPQSVQQSSQQSVQAQQQQQQAQAAKAQIQQQQQARTNTKVSKDDEESDDDGEQEESYENLEGAYNAKDYQHLNVSAEVRDLFQYIERYRPQEVELDTTLKCFIPEYIPAIGEMDAFIKIPRPDGKDDDMGLKFLDEPATSQSDPTVLELQLRAMSKKLQYGDVVVRSIDNAAKNPSAIDKWIQSISDLHRSKPPPQVHYRRNMPDIENLMDVWPEEFEALLEGLQLPSPDLDLSLSEYSKILCSILDIPTYENPIESLHLMFTLYMDFRNNPHFQARLLEDGASMESRREKFDYGGANVLEIDPGYK